MASAVSPRLDEDHIQAAHQGEGLSAVEGAGAAAQPDTAVDRHAARLPCARPHLWLILAAFRRIASADTLQVNEALAASLSSEGILWFTDLTVADTTMAIPLMLGAINLLNIEVVL